MKNSTEQLISNQKLIQIRNKLTEFFEFDFEISRKANVMHSYISAGMNVGNMNIGLMQQICQAYKDLSLPLYKHLYSPKEENFLIENEIQTKNELTLENIQYLTEQLYEIHKSQDVRKKMAAQAFLSLHMDTIEQLIKDKKIFPETVDVASLYQPSTEHSAQIGALFKTLSSLCDSTEFEALNHQYQTFLSEVNFLMNFGDLIKNKAIRGQLFPLDQLKNQVEEDAESFLFSSALIKNFNFDKLIDSSQSYLASLILGLEEDEYTISQSSIDDSEDEFQSIASFSSVDDELSDTPLHQNHTIIAKENSVFTNDLSLLQQCIVDFKQCYSAVFNESQDDLALENAITDLKEQLNRFVENVALEFVAVFHPDTDQDQKQQQLQDTQADLLALKTFLIEQGCPIRIDSTIETLRKSVIKHIHFLLTPFVEFTPNDLIERQTAAEINFDDYTSVQKKTFLSATLTALQNMHAKGVLHRNLNLDHILYDENTGQVEIIPSTYTISKHEIQTLNKKAAYSNYKQLNLPHWMAPEHCSLLHPVTEASDIYSLYDIIEQVDPVLLHEAPFEQLNAEIPQERPPLFKLIKAIEKQLEQAEKSVLGSTTMLSQKSEFYKKTHDASLKEMESLYHQLDDEVLNLDEVQKINVRSILFEKLLQIGSADSLLYFYNEFHTKETSLLSSFEDESVVTDFKNQLFNVLVSEKSSRNLMRFYEIAWHNNQDIYLSEEQLEVFKTTLLEALIEENHPENLMQFYKEHYLFAKSDMESLYETSDERIDLVKAELDRHISNYMNRYKEYSLKEKIFFFELYSEALSPKQMNLLKEDKEPLEILDLLQKRLETVAQLKNYNHYFYFILPGMSNTVINEILSKADDYQYENLLNDIQKLLESELQTLENIHTDERAEGDTDTLKTLLAEVTLMKACYNTHEDFLLLKNFQQNNKDAINEAITIAYNLDQDEHTSLYREALIHLAIKLKKPFLLAAAYAIRTNEKAINFYRLVPNSNLHIDHLVNNSSSLLPQSLEKIGIQTPGNHSDNGLLETFRLNYLPKTFGSRLVVDQYNTFAKKLNEWDFSNTSFDDFLNANAFHPAIYAELAHHDILGNNSQSIRNFIMNHDDSSVPFSKHQASLFALLLNQHSPAFYLTHLKGTEKGEKILFQLLELYPYLSFEYKKQLARALCEENNNVKKFIDSFKLSKENLKAKEHMIAHLGKIARAKDLSPHYQEATPALFYLYQDVHILDSLEEPLPSFVYHYIRKATGTERALLIDAIGQKLVSRHSYTKHDYWLLAAILDEVIRQPEDDPLYAAIINQMISHGNPKNITDAIYDLASFMPKSTERQKYLEVILNDDKINARIQYNSRGIQIWKSYTVAEDYTKLLSLYDDASKSTHDAPMVNHHSPELLQALMDGDINQCHEILGDNPSARQALLFQMIEDTYHYDSDMPSLIGCAIIGGLFQEDSGQWRELMPELEYLIEALKVPSTPQPEEAEDLQEIQMVNGFGQ